MLRTFPVLTITDVTDDGTNDVKDDVKDDVTDDVQDDVKDDVNDEVKDDVKDAARQCQVCSHLFPATVPSLNATSRGYSSVHPRFVSSYTTVLCVKL